MRAPLPNAAAKPRSLDNSALENAPSSAPVSTFRLNIRTPGATPCAPVPSFAAPMTPAISVPCRPVSHPPYPAQSLFTTGSPFAAPLFALNPASMREANSELLDETPSSTMATTTPSPNRPALYAASTPVCSCPLCEVKSLLRT